MPKLSISSLAPDELERIRAFAPDRFGSVMPGTRAQVESSWMAEIAELFQEETTLALTAERDATVCGFALCTPTPWESRLLEQSMWAVKYLAVDPKVAEVDLVAASLVAEVTRQLSRRGANFVLCKAEAAEPVLIKALETDGFLRTDTLLDFVCDCQKVRAQNAALRVPEGFTLRLAVATDLEPLAETARAAFAQHFGRFHADPRIGQTAATRVYEEWIRSCAQGWADWVYVAMNGERVAGYSAWKKPSPIEARHGLRLGHYSIGAVHPVFAGRGLFETLTRAGMAQLCGSTDWIEGPTHIENRAVQHVYRRLGWEEVGAHHSFHRWLTN